MKQSDHRPVRALIEIKLENAIDELITDQVFAVCTEATVAVNVTVCLNSLNFRVLVLYPQVVRRASGRLTAFGLNIALLAGSLLAVFIAYWWQHLTERIEVLRKE
jgi:hypothetical protein